MLLVGIQLVPVDRTNPPVGTEIDPPAEVERILLDWSMATGGLDRLPGELP